MHYVFDGRDIFADLLISGESYFSSLVGLAFNSVNVIKQKQAQLAGQNLQEGEFVISSAKQWVHMAIFHFMYMYTGLQCLLQCRIFTCLKFIPQHINDHKIIKSWKQIELLFYYFISLSNSLWRISTVKSCTYGALTYKAHPQLLI